MSNDPLDDVPEYYQPDDMSRLIRNLGEVGWLKGNQFVDGECLSIHYSETGVKRMQAMIPVIRRYAPGICGVIRSTNSPINASTFAAEILLIAPELAGKISTIAEGNALVALIASYAIDNGGDLPPNSRGVPVSPLSPA